MSESESFDTWLREIVNEANGKAFPLKDGTGYLTLSGHTMRLGDWEFISLSGRFSKKPGIKSGKELGPVLSIKLKPLSDAVIEIGDFKARVFQTDFIEFFLEEWANKFPQELMDFWQRIGVEKGDAASTTTTEQADNLLGDGSQDDAIIEAVRKQVIELQNQGYDLQEIHQQEIAKRLGYAPRTFRRFQKRYGYKRWGAFRMHLITENPSKEAQE